jgi:nitroreductase
MMGGVSDRFDLPTIHPLLASRWSPTAFDAAHDEDWSTVDLLLEAARWAPSAGNSQPWAFVVGLRGDPVHARLVRHLARSSGRWAPTASILIANLSHRLVEGTDWDYSEFAHYDLGQAVAHVTVQARALGLFVRQFRAFDRDAVAAEFAVPDHWEVTTMCAVGRVRPGSSGGLPAGDVLRDRRPLGDLLWPAAATGDTADQG